MRGGWLSIGRYVRGRQKRAGRVVHNLRRGDYGCVVGRECAEGLDGRVVDCGQWKDGG